MEQKENITQHGGELFASLRRLRAQGKRLRGAETHSSNEGFQWNEATSNYIHESDGEVTLHEENSPVQKKLFARKRFPLVPIVEDSNVIPKSGERVGILDTLSTKKQCPSESRLRIRRALHRRSCVPSFRNTESLSPNKADDYAFKDSKVKKTITGISPAAYSSWETQDGGSAREPQESFAQSLGITGESRLAGRGRRRSQLLWQEEGSQTKTGVEEEYCHQSVTKKQDEMIAENEETTNWGSQLLIQSRSKEASNSGIPESDEDVTLNGENSSVQKKLFARKRFRHVPFVEDSNVIPESVGRVGILGTQSTKNQCPSESRLRIRRALHRRSCVPSIMNAESLSPNKSDDSAFKDSKVKKTITGISPAAYSSGMIQDGSSAWKPQESFAQSLGITGESRLAGRGRRRSQLLWQEEGSQTKTGVEEEYCHQSVTKKQDETIAENEETANWGSQLQSRSKEESRLRIRRALQRRSCVPSFRNTESLSLKKADDSAFKDSKVKKTIMGISPAPYSSGEIHDGSSAREPQESFAQSLSITANSRLAGKGRRRSKLLWQEEGSQTEAGVEEEYCHQSVTKKQAKTTGENEETANWGSQLLIQSRSKEDNQKEAACGNKTKSETHVLGAERGGRATIRNNSVERRRLNRWTPYGDFGRNVKQTDVQVTDLAGQESQECRRMLQFESHNMSDGAKEITSPLVMMTQTPIISRASVLQNPVGQNQVKEVCEPMIKKSLLDHTMKTSRFKRRWSSRLHPHPDNTSGESHQNKKQNISGSGNKCENSLDEPLVGCKKEPRRKDQNHAPGDTASKLCRAVKESNPDVCTTTNSVRKSKFPQHPESTKIPRRRSVAVLGLRTPLRRKSTNFKVKSTSKLKGSTISSKIPEPKESKNCAELNKSLASTSNSSLHPQISDIVLPDSEGQEEDNLSQKNVPKDVSLKADVSTNTSFNFVNGKHEDMSILNDIENLLKEQEEINIKASLLQKKIEARRLDMKEKKVMESFMTSVSPLKRLRAVISKTIVDDGSGLQNPQPCKTEGEGDAQGPHAIDQSEVDWKSPKVVPAITYNHTHWRRQQNKRLVRALEESTPDNEEFLDPCQGSSSPFTTLVGDCERPSLAPMTPHSRLQVSQLKKSLRKQLEQLYD
ncbi:uncharacterized protein LOC127010423 isoform X2 [Eriocheir sinensis]|nr:uncharacterized protein LOC127010423 isoform X2 [Eriocheir sinensis]